MKINSKHYVLMILALMSIVLTVYGYYFIYKKTIAQAEHYINSIKEVKDAEKRIQSEQQLSKIYASTKDSRSRIASFIIQDDKIIDFIEKIESVGRDSGTELEISSISNDAGKVKAKIDVKGSWAQVMTALTLLENIAISSSINNVHIDVSSDIEKGVHTWNLSLDIEALTIK